MAFGSMKKDVFGSERVFYNTSADMTASTTKTVAEITIPSTGWWFVEGACYIATQSGNGDALYVYMKTPKYTGEPSGIDRQSYGIGSNAYVHMGQYSASRLYYFEANQKVQLQASTNGSTYRVTARYLMATKVHE